jgi:3-hydroxyacyl-[acyl-carrier-protein] dehydratase
MQAGAVLLAQFLPPAGNQIPVATRLSDVKFRTMVRPNDEVEIDVRLVERLANAFYLEAKMTCQGREAVRFQFACTVATVP